MGNWGWLITAGVIILLFAGTGIYLRRKIQSLVQLLFGTGSLAEGLRNREMEEATTPKSVSSMTSIYLPLIQADFPEFNWNEYQIKAGNVLKSFLLAIDRQEAALLDSAANADLCRQTTLWIEEERKAGARSRFADVAIHRTEITGYRKSAGTCIISLQSALGCLAWKERDGEVDSGSDSVTRQTKYDLSLVYVQDADKLQNADGAAVAATCPNCGAPITTLGHKRCAYCGAAVETINIRVWSFGQIRESARFAMPAR